MRLLVGYTNQIPQVAGKRPLPGREKAGDDILAFGAGYAHVNVTPEMDWLDILAQCPIGWTPDVYIHWSPEYNPIPAGLEQADCLTVGVFGDWNLGGQAMRVVGGLFDVLIADCVGCERLRNMGFANVLHGLLWAHEPDKHRILGNPTPRLRSPENAASSKYRLPEHRTPEHQNTNRIDRDIDILMIGNFNHAIQWERAKWLARVARLSARYKVVLTSGVYGEEYIRLMNRAKIIFNRSIRGEANMRAYEAPACGALMFYEAENREIRDVYTDQEHCVLYDDNTLEDYLAFYLAPENAAERERITCNGRVCVTQHSYAHHFADILNNLEPYVASHKAGTLPPRPFRQLPPAQQTLQLATHWLLTCNVGVYAKAGERIRDKGKGQREEKKRRREEEKTEEKFLSTINYQLSTNLSAVLAGEMARCAVSPEYARQYIQQAIRLARQVTQQEPKYVLGRVNLAYLHLAAGQAADGEKALREAAEQLPPPLDTWQMQGVAFPRCFQWFDVAMERVYGEHAPESEKWRETMQSLLTCRVHLTLAEITFARGQFAESARHAETAVQEMPAIGETYYARACACRALGQVEEAIAAYQETLNCAPFHVETREALPRLCLDVERAGLALRELDEWLAILNGCPVYANLIPATQTLRRQAQAILRQQANAESAAGNGIKRLLALPDWNKPAEWQSLVQAFACAYAPEDPALLMLRADPATHPNAQALLQQLERFLRHTLAIAADRLPNITLVNQPLPPADCWKLLHVADALIADHLPAFWRELAQARCLPILTSEQIGY